MLKELLTFFFNSASVVLTLFGKRYSGARVMSGDASVAQLVELYLAKVDVEGSSPFARSKMAFNLIAYARTLR